jgi:hypothetical protein
MELVREQINTMLCRQIKINNWQMYGKTFSILMRFEVFEVVKV